jgi:hypothetical protein
MIKNKAFLLFVVFSILLAACAAPVGAPAQSANGNAAQPAVDAGQSKPSAGGATQANSSNTATTANTSSLTYRIADTGQIACYDNNQLVACAAQGAAFAGQDGNYQGAAAAYQDNGDGTVSDLTTGLMWTKSPDLNGDGAITASDKLSFANAMSSADSVTVAGYDDWRLPTIKELYSLILFDGTDVSACPGGTCSATPFIDTRYFDFAYGDTNAGERVIDAQFATSTKYVSTTMNGDETMFGVNFADGRIKGYGLKTRGNEKTFFVLYVRGNSNYGINQFSDNGNGTISDNATGLVWSQADSASGMNWSDALVYCEGSSAAGFDDWRLPNAKELQSIVDYSRSPATSNSAAIDPIFSVTSITNEAGETDYPFYWSGTTHADSSGRGSFAAYVSFGKALGYMNSWVDVHGAGAQRSDPKTGSASDYPQGHGPQGDAVRVNNYVRCVRGGEVTYVSGNTTVSTLPSMSIVDASAPGAQQSQQGQGQQTASGQQQQGQQGQGGTPPQAAIDACTGLSQGTTCSMKTPKGTMNGTCGTPLNQSQMACIPAGGPPSP